MDKMSEPEQGELITPWFEAGLGEKEGVTWVVRQLVLRDVEAKDRLALHLERWWLNLVPVPTTWPPLNLESWHGGDESCSMCRRIDNIPAHPESILPVTPS